MIDVGGDAGSAVLVALRRPAPRSGEVVCVNGEEILRLFIGGGVRGEDGGECTTG